MEITSFLKFTLSDDASLHQYIHGEYIQYVDVKRRLFLIGREQNKNIPDHYYRLEQERSFKNLPSLSMLITKGFFDLSQECLELINNRLYVKQEMQNHWQELITYIPPLLLQSAFLSERIRFDHKNKDLPKYFLKYILPNSRYTALPRPRIQALETFAESINGFHDLHMHLNGATETDNLWQMFLKNPLHIYRDLCKAYSVSKVREQLEQESTLLNPTKYIFLLQTAQKLRRFFYDYLFTPSNSLKYGNKHILLNKLLYHLNNQPRSCHHDFLPLINADPGYPHLSSVEGMMYILIMTDLRKNENEMVSSLFHFYLLILGLTNRLLVQQVHQKGFEQFQKNTLNGMREQTERKFTNRFFQMHGNDYNNLHFLEGRFAPKVEKKELVSLLRSIDDGWAKFEQKLSNISPGETRQPLPEFKLIAHFIKKEDEEPDPFVRHKKLRYKVWMQARVLAGLINDHPKFTRRIVGIDAAASEFDAPPEVFAPAFRYMRKAGIQHFTYHAGEDFFHIICGLRAVYEAILFCGLKPSDRIGHATATGISVRSWHLEVGDRILIRQGEYLDSLVFSYHIIKQQKIETLSHITSRLVDRIKDLCQQIYGQEISVSILEKAWLLRQCCPAHTLQKNKSGVELLSVYNPDEWNWPTSCGLINDRRQIESDPSWKVYRAYHDEVFRITYSAIIPVEPFEIFSIPEIELLQLSLLHYMNQREIVIETLPTSNVRIGFHRNFKSYHLLNWLDWKRDGRSIPPIVVGSDDTGIFATNIYNEYGNIYCCLLNEKSLPRSVIMNTIKQLDEDSRVYKFS